MEHAKKFVAFVAGIGKVIGVIVGLGTIGGTLVGFAMWAGTRASATEVTKSIGVIERRQDVAEVKAENEVEWRRWMVKQMERISRRVGAEVAPPPVQAQPAYGPLPNDAPR